MRWLLVLFLALGIVEAHAVDVGIYNEPQSSSAGAAAAISGSAITPSSVTTGQLTATNISATNNTTVSNLLVVGIIEVKPSTSTSLPSTTQLLYMRPAADGQMQMDSALGAAYDNVSNRVTIGTPSGAAVTFGDTLRVSGTQTTTGLFTATGISNTANESVTGNLDVTGTLRVVSTSNLGNVSVSIIGATLVSTSALLVSSADSVSLTGLGFLFTGTGGSQPQICQQRNGIATWCQTINNPTAYSISVSGSNPIVKVDPNGVIIGKNINTGVNATNALQVSGTFSVTGGVSMTGLATTTATGNLCIVEATGVVVSSTSLSGCLGVSDPLAKKDIRPIPYGLHELMQVDAIAYKDLRTDLGAFPGEQVGLLAYDTDRNGVHYNGLEKVMPELVTTGGDWHGHKLKAVIYERMVAVEAKAIQEQQAQIQDQQREIEELQAQMDELRLLNGLQPLQTRPWWRRWLGIE